MTILGLDDLPSRIWPLPCRAVNGSGIGIGIGLKVTMKLEGLGIHTNGELAWADPAWLLEHIGRSYGSWRHEAAHLREDRPLTLSREPKSNSQVTAFEHDLYPKLDREALSRVLLDLRERLTQDLARQATCPNTSIANLAMDI